MIPMASKAIGKYYAQFYCAKKSPAKVRRAKLIRHVAFIAAAVAIVATAIAAWQISRSDDTSFMEVAASHQTLSDVAEYPRVVNHAAPIAHDYVPQNLVSLNTVPNGESVYLRADAAEAFLDMLKAMSEDGLGVFPVKGYTSYEEQLAALTTTADKFVAEGASAEEARQQAEDYLLPPGEDEAQLGTCVDISTDLGSVDGFSATEQNQWICANAHQFGFIVRYTSGKQAITGISAKPWHLRFVGKDAAEYMKAHNLCLEEYVKLVQNDCPGATEEK